MASTVFLAALVFAVKVSSAEDTCQEIMVPMCRGLIGYTHTKLPNNLKHKNQRQVYRFLEPIWQFMDMKCSNNLRLLACGMALPKCIQNENTTMIEEPCKEACFYAKKECKKVMKKLGLKWPKKLKCKKLRRKKQKKCIKPKPKMKVKRLPQYAYCQQNSFPMCQNLTFEIGTLPNMFSQDDEAEILTELEQYRPLVDTECHQDLRFLLCGIFRPYCIRSNPITLPCREICEDVRKKCEKKYRKLFGGLRWPSKLQCHRYPPASAAHNCVVPEDTALVGPIN